MRQSANTIFDQNRPELIAAVDPLLSLDDNIRAILLKEYRSNNLLILTQVNVQSGYEDKPLALHFYTTRIKDCAEYYTVRVYHEGEHIGNVRSAVKRILPAELKRMYSSQVGNGIGINTSAKVIDLVPRLNS